jgi:DNA-binding winged helix-turn-helix (wHTH) protein/WD40 repeat protein
MHRAFNALNSGAETSIVALRFGPFELDTRSGELRRNGTTLRLQPQPVKVLLLLAARPGEVVAREEIQAEVWPAGTFVDFEQSLNFCIRQIRAALGDNALAPRYVETLPRRGYRWVGGPVERVTGGTTVNGWPRAVEPSPAAGQEVVLPARATGVLRLRPRWSLVGVIAALALAALATGFLIARARPRLAEHPSFQRVTFRRGALSSARFGPDGQVVYSAAWDGGASLLYVARSDPRDVQALGIEDAVVVGVAPSGEVAFLREGVLARAPLAGGPPKDVLKDVVAADWTTDGRDFAVARSSNGRYRIEFPVGHVLEQTRAHPRALRLSRDGQHLAVVLYPTLADDRGLVEILDRDGRRAAATPEWASLDGLAWGPDGSEVWFTASQVGSDNSLRALGVDGRVRLVLSGTGRLVLHDIAPDGRVLLERATLRSEMLFRRTGEPAPRDLSWLDYSAAAGISPDGGTVLFYESGEGGGPDYSTFLRRTDGSPPVRVGPGRALDISPDGRFVLSVDLRQPDHLDLTPTGPGETRRLRVPGIVAHEEAGFVGDGRRVFVTGRDAEGARTTWIVDLSGSSPRRLPLPEGRFLVADTFSPDGGHFVARCAEGKTACFYDTVSGNPSPVRGAKEGWMAVGFDASGQLYFRTRGKRPPDTLLRLDPATGRTALVAELSPLDPDGASWVQRVFVARSGAAWAYNVLGRLSDLHVVTGLD